jgi:murein DD-endopeptidase MepM/ murein hydrolase activator NlpD
MFLLSSIQAITLGIISLLMPSIFSGLQSNLYYGCYVEITEEKKYTPGYFVVNSVSQEINKETHHLLHEMGWPVANPVISSGWGQRSPSCKGCSSYHQGVDFVPGIGTPVMAAMRGTVSIVENSSGYGVHVIIEHDLHSQVWHTVYAHLQNNSVPESIKPGTYVEIGDVIGKVGNTGTSTGPHLHFEVRIDGIKVNPLPLLNKNVPSN